MTQPAHPPDVDTLALEYLRGAETGNPPDLEILVSQLPDESQRQELRSIVETAEWARASFPVPFRPRSIVAGRYCLEEELGSGGFGKVWRASDQKLGRPVALKLFHPLIDPAELESTLRRERDSLARINHDGVVRLLDSGRHEETHFLAMEYVPGRTLDKVLAALAARGSGAPLPDRAAVAAAIGGAPTPGESSLLEDDWYRTVARINVAILWALSAAHGHQIHHRDLKPGNVLLRPSGRPVLLDFGLAGLGDLAQGTLTGRLFGTAAYLAPEQLERQRTGKDQRTDIYQCGLLLYEMLTFRRAFAEAERSSLLEAVRRGDIESPRQQRRDVPVELADICMRALERNPDRRYASAEAYRDDLERWLDGRLPSASRLGVVGRATRRARRFAVTHRTAVLATALVLLGGLSTAWFAFQPDPIEWAELADGSWSLRLRNSGHVFAWMHCLDSEGRTIAAQPLYIATGEAKSDLEVALPGGRSTVRVELPKVAAVSAARTEIRWRLAEDDQAADWEQYMQQVAVMARERERFLDKDELLVVYQESRTGGKGAGGIGELPIDELLR